MASSGCLVSEQKPNGFDFDLCKRNAWLEKQGLQTLKPWSTGTTICGVVYKVRVFFSFFFETFLQSKRTDDLTPSASLSLSLIFFLSQGRSGSWRGHEVDRGGDGGGQELREDPLHGPEHLLLRRGNRRGYRERHGNDLLPVGAP